MNNVKDILDSQQAFFATGETLPLSFRREMLKKLYKTIKSRQEDICAALNADLGKSPYESYMCEIGLTLSEISYMLSNLGKLAKKQRVRTPLSQFPAKSYTLSMPYGNVLIISPWNYPFLLSVSPLVNAIAAGNTAVVKPSAYSPAVSKLLAELIAQCFAPHYVACVTGGRAENALLLQQPFNMVFFTGSKEVGKTVLRHTAENLTPTVLELGGKSPCIVDNTADVALAARRIVFGKFLNCGQTCVAPDYILCDERVKKDLIVQLKRQIEIQFGANPISNPNYGKIINQKHFDRLLELIDKTKLAAGGKYNREALKISPTVLENVTPDDKVMSQEIFGPILPVITYKSFNNVINGLKTAPKPLALYLFSESKQNQNQINRLTYGGGCINDVVVHLATHHMPFGGVGESGMGAYHGKTGFNAFSHTKSILHKSGLIDLNMRYQPYKKRYKRLIEWFLR